jgi:uncharacterized protein YodC (DUF2158 family)
MLNYTPRFERGSTVTLASGGLPMTVASVREDRDCTAAPNADGQYPLLMSFPTCVWHDSYGILHRQEFAACMLESAGGLT